MLKGQSILLGVSGGIAAYKAAELVRLIVKEGGEVRVVMTANAQRFVTPMTFQALSGHPVGTDLFDLKNESQIGHIELARWADLVCLAPATANIIAKLSSGIADDFLSTILVATKAPVLVCPAMNPKMYENPITQRNLGILREYGYHIIEPESGELACGEEGPGRLADLHHILEAIGRLTTLPTLAGKRVLISAGPTWEPFDPVRFISNPSSGKMGYALARVAARRAGDVYLVSGPTSLPVPNGINFTRVVTALEMHEAIMDLAPGMDVIVMAAAISDYRPLRTAPQKVKKTADDMVVELVKNPDILRQLGNSRSASKPKVLVGFAAETENLIENATSKLLEKNLDFIVANNLTQRGCGFACDTNEVKIITPDGSIEEIPKMSKEKVAEIIFDRIEKILFANQDVP